MIPLVSADQMRAVEAAEFARGTTEDELSSRAADAIAARLDALIRTARLTAPVLVLAGPGNNGLDAVKVHDRLRDAGVESVLHCWRRRDCPGLDVQALRLDLERAGTVLDGLFGIGLARDVGGEPAEVLRLVNATRDARRCGRAPLRVVAIDIPSGLDADSGEVLGVVADCDMTLTLGLPKLGLYSGTGPSVVGEVIWEDIGLNTQQSADVSAQGFNSREQLELPSRSIGSHKNDNGRVLVLGGSLKYPGAPVLAAKAAQRAGAGYVTVAFPRSLYGVVGAQVLEQTLWPLPESEPGTLGAVTLPDAREAAETYGALVLGNGIGREDDTVAFVLQLLGLQSAAHQRRVGFRTASSVSEAAAQAAALPRTIVDGDGLYALSTHDHWWEGTPSVALLTPHPGEMGRLLGCSVDEVEANRIGVAREAAERWGKTVVLKGSYPVVATPGAHPEVLREGHPELGTAGTGDVLAGVCGYLLAVGLEPSAAARAALVLGARAASLAASEVGADSVSAGDVLAALPRARRSDSG